MRVSNPDYRIAVATDVHRSLLKAQRKSALRLVVLIPALRVFGLAQTWIAIPELFVVTRRRYVARASLLCASDVSQSF